MPVTYVQRHKIRERILLYGGPGGGKSSAVASIILHTPDVHHHIVDTEIDNYERIFAEDPLFAAVLERQNYTIHPVDSTDWVETLTTCQKAGALCEPRDWLHLDMITESWEAVQRWFTDQIYTSDLEDFFLERRRELEAQRDGARTRKAAGDKDAKEQASQFTFDGRNDYGKVINPQYKRLYRVFMSEIKCHSTIVAEEDSTGDNDIKAIREMVSGAGADNMKPKGQKRLLHVPHTAVRLTKKRKSFIAHTVKDRSRRKYLDEEEYGEDFAKRYLTKVARWKVAKFDG